MFSHPSAWDAGASARRAQALPCAVSAAPATKLAAARATGARAWIAPPPLPPCGAPAARQNCTF